MTAALGLLGTGCDRGGVARLPVWGTVSRAGGGTIDGSITFLPAQGRRGPSATTALVAGQYRFDRDSGPTAGPHRVIVAQRGGKDKALKMSAHQPSPASAEAGRGDGKTAQTLSADVPASAPYRCDLKLGP